MRVLVAYRSKYGTCEKAARLLAERISGEVVLADLKRERPGDLSAYGTVLIGGSIYAGTIQKEIRSFCESRQQELLDRQVGLFLCCLYTGEKARLQLQASFPDWLLAHAFAALPVGGELHLDRLSLPDRIIMKVLGKQREDIRNLDTSRIDQLAQAAAAAAAT